MFRIMFGREELGEEMPVMRRQTIKKAIILNELKKMDTHPTATEFSKKLQKEGIEISRATVFRVLSSLADDGIIKRVEVENSDTRYDGNTSLHYHFNCRHCGKVMDVDVPYHAELNHLLELQGFDVEGHNTDFYGTCPDCREEMNAEKE